MQKTLALESHVIDLTKVAWIRPLVLEASSFLYNMLAGAGEQLTRQRRLLAKHDNLSFILAKVGEEN